MTQQKVLKNIQKITGTHLRLYRNDCLDLFLSHEKIHTGKNKNKLIQDIRKNGPRFAVEILEKQDPIDIMALTYQQVDQPSKFDIGMTIFDNDYFPNFCIVLNKKFVFGFNSLSIAGYIPIQDITNEVTWWKL